MKKSIVVPVLLTLLVLVIGLGVFQIVRLYNKPMAEPLALPATQNPSTDFPTAAAQAIQPTAPVLATAAPVCGSTGRLTVLVTGVDASTNVWPNGADAIRLVQVDFDARTIRVVAFPRDLKVPTAGLSDLNMSEQPLGLAYFFRKEATAGSDREKIIAGTNLLAQTIYEDFAVRSDHYVTLQLNVVKDMIDTVGGVDILRTEAITSEHNVTFPAGAQTLNGDQAAEYVRFLYPGGEESRLARQNQLLQALLARVINVGILPQVPTLVEQFGSAITTDLSPNQIVDLACAVDQAGKDRIEFYEIVGEGLVSQGNDGTLLPNVDAIRAFLAEKLKSE